VGVAALVVGGAEFVLPRLALTLGLVAAVAAGHVAGRPLFARLAAGHYEQVVAGLLLISVITGAVVALA
jgi:hypothetical protein